MSKLEKHIRSLTHPHLNRQASEELGLHAVDEEELSAIFKGAKIAGIISFPNGDCLPAKCSNYEQIYDAIYKILGVKQLVVTVGGVGIYRDEGRYDADVDIGTTHPREEDIPCAINYCRFANPQTVLRNPPFLEFVKYALPIAVRDRYNERGDDALSWYRTAMSEWVNCGSFTCADDVRFAVDKLPAVINHAFLTDGVLIVRNQIMRRSCEV